jgi:hypothetical protein
MSSKRRSPPTRWKVPKMPKAGFARKDWLVPPFLFPLFLATLVVVYALMRTAE